MTFMYVYFFLFVSSCSFLSHCSGQSYAVFLNGSFLVEKGLWSIVTLLRVLIDNNAFKSIITLVDKHVVNCLIDIFHCGNNHQVGIEQ